MMVSFVENNEIVCCVTALDILCFLIMLLTKKWNVSRLKQYKKQIFNPKTFYDNYQDKMHKIFLVIIRKRHFYS